MCGIFGIVTKKKQIDVNKFNLLGIMNDERGGHSYGIAIINKNCVSLHKNNKTFFEGITHKKTKKFLSFVSNGILAGHTRFGTRGANIPANAHPYTYKHITGAHNGIIYNAPNKYQVDSMYIFDLLSKYEDYSYCFNQLDGYFAIWFYDDIKEKFFFISHNAQLSYYMNDNELVFSSDENHLALVTGVNDKIATASNNILYSIDKSFNLEKQKIDIKDYEFSHFDYYRTSGKHKGSS